MSKSLKIDYTRKKMKEKKYLVLGITLVLLTFVGVSLAYFLTTINTKDLRIIFTNGDAIEDLVNTFVTEGYL